MDILVPIDNSECSYRALQYGARLGGLPGADLHVVHFTARADGDTRRLLARAEDVIEKFDIEDEPEFIQDQSVDGEEREVGKIVLEVARDRDYDQVIMGHHGSDLTGRARLGSAAEEVVRGSEIPVTVIP